MEEKREKEGAQNQRGQLQGLPMVRTKVAGIDIGSERHWVCAPTIDGKGPRTVYLAFDADQNGSGQRAAQSLANRLTEHGVSARTVSPPEGHDPNSFFAQSGDAHQFQCLLKAAR